MVGRGESRFQNRAYSIWRHILRFISTLIKHRPSVSNVHAAQRFFLRKPIAKRREVDFYQVNAKSNRSRFFCTRDVKTEEMPRKERRQYRLFAYFTLPFACSPPRAPSVLKSLPGRYTISHCQLPHVSV